MAIKKIYVSSTQLTKLPSKIIKIKKIEYYFLYSILLSSCGSQKSDHITTTPVEGSIDADPTTAAYISLEENTDYVSNTTNPEVISTNYNIFKSITRIQDDNLSDSDKIFIKTNEDIITTPIISGFEDIIFEVAETFTGPDSQFYVDLSNLSGFDQIVFSQSNLPTAIKEIAVMNAQGSLYFNRPYSDISATVKLGESLSIESNNDAEIKIFGAGKDIILDGNGDALNISTSNHGNIEIIENSSVFLTAPNATGDLSIISNGNISIENVGSLLGNITLSGVGTIALDNASSLIGKLEVDNMRASAGNDITIINASSAAAVNINSVGSIVANTNNGFNEAKAINLTAAEDSSISAFKGIERSVSLNSSNYNFDSVIFDIDISGINDLVLGGFSPILVKLSGENLSGVDVSSTNSSSASLYPTAANIDLSKVSNTIQIYLPNTDGKQLTVGQNQLMVLDAEVKQTADNSTPEFNFVTPATSSSSNSITLKTTNNSSNISDVVSIDNLNIKDIQTINFDLGSGTSLDLTGTISGEELSQVNLSGTGNVNLTNGNIVGSINNLPFLNAANLSGNLNLIITNVPNSTERITAGDGNDTIEIDTTSKATPGIVVDAGAGNDLIKLTSNSSSNSAISNIDGGAGIDTIKFSPGLDYSLNDLTVVNVEKLEFSGGSSSTKLQSDVLTGKTLSLSKENSNDLTLELIPKTQVIDLSKLDFDSINLDTDVIVLDGNNFSQALTITGSDINDKITGTYTANDTIISGDGNDIVDGSDGNDTLTPGNGSDRISSGMGNDTINLSENHAAQDTLHYSIDYGSANVDTVTGFDVRVVNDIISIDVSELSTPITVGDGSTAKNTNAGNISIIENALDANISHASNTTESIIKLMQTDKNTFAAALGTGEIAVADGACINFLWYNTRDSQAVYGYVSEASSADDDNKITNADTFVEIVKLSISEASFTHYLDADNFAYV